MNILLSSKEQSPEALNISRAELKRCRTYMDVAIKAIQKAQIVKIAIQDCCLIFPSHSFGQPVDIIHPNHLAGREFTTENMAPEIFLCHWGDLVAHSSGMLSLVTEGTSTYASPPPSKIKSTGKMLVENSAEKAKSISVIRQQTQSQNRVKEQHTIAISGEMIDSVNNCRASHHRREFQHLKCQSCGLLPKQPVSLRCCGITICQKCILNEKECPFCREMLLPTDIVQAKIRENAVARFVQHFSVEETKAILQSPRSLEAAEVGKKRKR